MKEKKWDGAVTVEAAIIMPVVLILIMTMLMFAVYIYEKAVIRSVCNEIASEGAVIWNRGSDYLEQYYANGKITDGYAETQSRIHVFTVYADFFTNLIDTGKNQKISALEAQLRKRFAQRSFLLDEGDISATVELESVLIHKKLNVTIEANYTLPFYSDHAVVTAQSVISGQADMIRNVDFAVDLVKPHMGGLVGKYEEVLDKLKELISKVKIEK